MHHDAEIHAFKQLAKDFVSVEHHVLMISDFGTYLIQLSENSN
jgi:hypothetical protein